MRKPTICIILYENKDAEQLRGNHEADQRLCFRYLDSTIPLLPKYLKISSLYPSPVAVQPGLCQTILGHVLSKPHCWFSHDAAHFMNKKKQRLATVSE